MNPTQKYIIPEQFKNQVLMQQIFKLKRGSKDKNNVDDHIIIKTFPCEVMCDEKLQDQQHKLNTIYFHIPLKYYDETKTDSEQLVDFANSAQLEPEWYYKIDPDQQTYSKYFTKEDIGCQHFVRGCQLLCNTCNKYYTCRFCHDEIEDHKFPKQETKMVKCIYCRCEQPFQQYCQNCKQCFGEQWCEICRAFCNIGNESKPMYHCKGCDSCMTGWAHQWRHCDKCNSCVRANCYDGHQCVKFDGTCPVCMGDLEDTIYGRMLLNCSHAIHKHCYDQLIRQGEYRCPVCRRFLPIEDEREILINYFKKLLKETVIFRPVRYVQFHCLECQRDFYGAFHSFVVMCGKCQLFNVETKENIIGNRELADEEWAKYPETKPKFCTVEDIREILQSKFQIELEKEWNIENVGDALNMYPKTKEQFLSFLQK
ncbi:RING_finger and CHY zinc finger domain-containing protein [Hexamita inflata]|uniref:RING_finger and CHY zinc finger domain-containing protein n=1 Tax=Hexamita inflata TaxID=28002 RepID=A0ABP1HFK2_9EUKA